MVRYLRRETAASHTKDQEKLVPRQEMSIFFTNPRPLSVYALDTLIIMWVKVTKSVQPLTALEAMLFTSTPTDRYEKQTHEAPWITVPI